MAASAAGSLVHPRHTGIAVPPCQFEGFQAVPVRQLGICPSRQKRRDAGLVALAAIARDQASVSAVQPRLLTWSSDAPAAMSLRNHLVMPQMRGSDQCRPVMDAGDLPARLPARMAALMVSGSSATAAMVTAS